MTLGLQNDFVSFSVAPDECVLPVPVDQRLLPSGATLPVLPVFHFDVPAIHLFLPPTLSFEFVALAAIGFANLAVVAAPHSIVAVDVVVQRVTDDALLSMSFAFLQAAVVNYRLVAEGFYFAPEKLANLVALVVPI